MKKFTFILAILGLIVLNGCKNPSEVEGPEIRHGTIVVDSVTASDTLIGTKAVNIYLPPGYDNDTITNYPVVYLLHGFGGDHNFWQDYEDIKDIADYLISTGDIKPMIIVMPDGKNVLGGSFYTNSRTTFLGSEVSVFGSYETYIVNDVVNYVDAHYRTIPDKDHRAIIGISMGAYGAMKLGIKHPDIFGIVGEHSGPIFFDQFIRDGVLSMVRFEWMDSTFGGRIPFKPAEYLGPQRPLTTMLIAMAGAFSPKVDFSSNFDSTKYELILQDSVFFLFGNPVAVGVRLPFDTTYTPDSVYYNEWLPKHDPATLFRDSLSNLLANQTKFYLDCGINDELMLTSHTEAFAALMDSLNYPDSLYTYDIFSDAPGYPNDLFPARHGTHLYFRIKNSLEFASRHFR